MPMSIPKVMEKGVIPKVFCESKMTSDASCKNKHLFQKKNQHHPPKKTKKLIIATINYSSVPFSGIIKFTDAKPLHLIGERDEIIWDLGACWLGFSCSTGRLLY